MLKKVVKNERMDDAAFFKKLGASMKVQAPKYKPTIIAPFKKPVASAKPVARVSRTPAINRPLPKRNDEEIGKKLAVIADEIISAKGIGEKNAVSVRELYEKFEGIGNGKAKPTEVFEFGTQLMILSGGKPVGITSQLDFEGATVSVNGQSIVVTFAGGGGFTELPATGTINGINTAFTFTKKPTYIVSDGAWYKVGVGWTWNAGTLTATMVIPPNNAIWGF